MRTTPGITRTLLLTRFPDKVFKLFEDFRGNVNILLPQFPYHLLPAFFPAFLAASFYVLLSLR